MLARRLGMDTQNFPYPELKPFAASRLMTDP